MIESIGEVLVSKNTRGSKEYTREQRLAKENKALKQELRHLRKVIARLDVDRFETMKEMCSDYEENERFQESVGPVGSSLDRLKKDWQCNSCGNGFLEITLYSKLGQTQYFRKCSACNYRTPGQRYDPETVKGIIKK